MKTLTIWTLIAVGAATGCASHSRQGAPPGAPRMGAMPDAVLAADAALFIEADANMDRRTTRVEWSAWSAATWKTLAGNDEAIGIPRFGAWTQSLFGPVDVASQFGNLSFDRDMNGAITAEEFSTELDRRFGFRDATDNGAIEREELWVRLPKMPSMSRPPSGMPPGGRPPGGPPGGGRPPGM
jgi:hypothetical protein